MVRSEDVPGADKHLRFGHYNEQLATLLVGFPGIKAIVLHTHGTKGEHPHLHVWWSGAAVTNQTIRNRLKAYHDTFKLMKSQNDWSFRNHESYEAWSSYVQRNKTHKVLYGDLPPPTDIIQLVIPTPQSLPTPSIPAPRFITKKLNAEERLINYCIKEIGFKHNQWGLAHYQTKEYRDKMHTDVSDALLTYANGRLDNRQMTYMGRNIIWTFSDADLRAHLTENWSAEAKKNW